MLQKDRKRRKVKDSRREKLIQRIFVIIEKNLAIERKIVPRKSRKNLL